MGKQCRSVVRGILLGAVMAAWGPSSPTVVEASESNGGLPQNSGGGGGLVGPPAPNKALVGFDTQDKPKRFSWGRLVVYGGGNLLDYGTTKFFESRGIPEGNPVIVRVGLTWVKVGLGFALSGLDFLLQKWAPDLVKPLRVLAGTFYLALGAHNVTAR